MKSRVRHFTGYVSVKAASDPKGELRLEHFLRIQTRLISFVDAHLASHRNDPEDFIRVIDECERVHIVTYMENYDAVVAAGDYAVAGIALVEWATIPPGRREILWKKMLRGRVANASDFQA